MTLLRLADRSEAQAILAAEDDFTRSLGSFDRSFRLRTTATVTDAELRSFLGEQALDFTAEEAVVWEEAMAIVASGARGIGRLLPPEVVVVKTTGREERDHAYTRGNAIVLPAARVRDRRGEWAFRLVAHELFHVLSRAVPSLRDAMYGLLGFEKIGPLAPPAELDGRRMTNPDAHALGHHLRLGDRAFVPMLLCPLPLADVLERTSVLGTMNATLLEVDPAAGAVVRDASGAPVVVDARTTDFATRIARNTKYAIHPEEVLADNLSLFVRKRLGSAVAPADADFLAAFERTLLSEAAGREI